MDIITAILILLASGIIAGRVSNKFGIPEVAGQLLVGFILGRAVLGFVVPSQSLTSIADIALFFIILLLGIEATYKTLTSNPSESTVLSFGSFVIPVIVMAAISYFVFGFNVVQSIVVSMGVGVPSISIVSVLLRHYSLIGTEDGDKILSSVVISDILAFTTLAILYKSTNIMNIFFLVATLLIFIVIMLIIARLLRRHYKFVRKFFQSLSKRRDGEGLIFAIVILLGLGIASILQLIGVTFVLGAFFAGMILEEFVVGKKVFGTLTRTFKRLDDSFFIPVFFTIAGAAATLPSLGGITVLIVLTAASAIFSTALVSFFGVEVFRKMKASSAMSILGGRGAVGVVIGSIAFAGGLIDASVYSIIILGTLILAVFFSVFFKPKAKRGSK